MASGHAGAAGAERWRESNGTSGAHSASEAAVAGASGVDRRLPALRRRFGTYEREHQERSSVLHYLTVATLLRARPANLRTATSADAGANDGGGNRGGGVDKATAAAAPVPPHPDGATTSELLAAMRESPWEGRPRATGTRREWGEWLLRLEPTLERHLRWLAVDGLASQSHGVGDALSARDGAPSRFLAVLPGAGREEDGAEPGGNESAGRLSGGFPAGGQAAATGGAGGGPGAEAGSLAADPSLLAGGMRIMKSRPIKMVKPWR